MKYLKLKTTDPYLNLAIEEYLFRNFKDDIFILWQNDKTVVIGKNQNARAEVDDNVLKDKKIKIARRITGGGAVYHDMGNVNYTFISGGRDNGTDFKYFTEPIISALSELGVEAELSGRNDILVDGKKISGNAQYSFGGRVLHHGTLLFDSELSVLSSVLNVDEDKIKSKALKSTRSRVANIRTFLQYDVSTEEFIKVIEEYVIQRFSPELIDVPNNKIIRDLYERNSSKEWLYPDTEFLSSYNIHRRRRFDFGIVSLYIELSADVLKSVKISGDFFEITDISELENKLIGYKLHDLERIISYIDVGSYISGMTNNQFVELIYDRF